MVVSSYLAAALLAIVKVLNRPARPSWTAGTTDVLITRWKSLPGLDFYLHSVNFGLPWSSCTASSSSCSSENDFEAPSPFDLQSRTIVLL